MGHLKFLSSSSLGVSESRISHGLECDPAEVQQLYNVSDRLDSLTEQHPLVSEALITISGSARSIGSAGGDEDNAALRTRSSKRLTSLVAISEAAFGVETSREGRHLEVNYELAAHSQRHSRGSLTPETGS